MKLAVKILSFPIAAVCFVVGGLFAFAWVCMEAGAEEAERWMRKP